MHTQIDRYHRHRHTQYKHTQTDTHTDQETHHTPTITPPGTLEASTHAKHHSPTSEHITVTYTHCTATMTPACTFTLCPHTAMCHAPMRMNLHTHSCSLILQPPHPTVPSPSQLSTPTHSTPHTPPWPTPECKAIIKCCPRGTLRPSQNILGHLPCPSGGVGPGRLGLRVPWSLLLA